jgi:hypothetical protein
MSITSFVVISSKYRTGDSRSTSDFTYSIGQSLEVSAVAVKSVSIPNVQYNINKHNNSLLVYYGDSNPASSATVVLPEGQYNTTSLITQLEALILSSTGVDLTIVQDALTGKLAFTSSTLAFKFSTDPIDSPSAKVLGLGDTASATYPDQVTMSLDCPFLINLSGLKNYYLASRVLSHGYNGIFKSGESLPLVMNIPIDVPYGAIEQYDPQDISLNLKTFSRPSNIQWIDIKILDEDLNVIDLNGGDIEIVLKIYTKESPLKKH